MSKSNWKSTFTTITVLVGIVGGTLGVTNYFASAKDVEDVKIESKKEREKIKVRLSLVELLPLYEKALSEKYFFRKQLREDPNNEELQNKLKEAEEEVTDLKELMKELKKKKVIQ